MCVFLTCISESARTTFTVQSVRQHELPQLPGFGLNPNRSFKDHQWKAITESSEPFRGFGGVSEEPE